MISELWIPIRFSFLALIKSGGDMFLMLQLVAQICLNFLKYKNQTHRPNALQKYPQKKYATKSQFLTPSQACVSMISEFWNFIKFYLWNWSNLVEIPLYISAPVILKQQPRQKNIIHLIYITNLLADLHFTTNAVFIEPLGNWITSPRSGTL